MMIFRRLAAAVLAVSLLGGGEALAQPFPTLKGDNARTGRNQDPNNSGPGQARLTWFLPYSRAQTVPIFVDNTDVADTSGYPAGPYDRFPLVVVPPTAGPPPDPGQNNGAEGSIYERRAEDLPGPWGVAASQPPYVVKAAYDPATEWARGTADNNPGGYAPLNRLFQLDAGQPRTPRDPAYVFTRATASAVGTDPTVALNPADRRYFEWTIQGAGAGPKSYAIYASIINTPTRRTGLDPLFPNRYAVYEILLGPNRRVIDVVDTFASGEGFVRLGNGGLATNALFQSDGVNPIRVRLYNTVPRDSGGQLLVPSDPNNPDRNPVDRCRDFVIHADAIRATPSLGYYRATPTVGGLDTDRRIVAALNQTVVDAVNDQAVVRTRGVVTSYTTNLTGVNDFSTVAGAALLNSLGRWTFVPPTASGSDATRDDASADTTTTGVWTTIASPRFLNGAYLSRPAQNVLANAARVTYAPPLPDGVYDVYVYLPGDQGGVSFARSVRYEVTEGTATGPLTTTYTLDQSQNAGWVRLGARRFSNQVATDPGSPPVTPIRVAVTDYSANAADAGRQVYADGVRFLAASQTNAVNSTPVQATARVRLAGGGGIAERRVVIVADEQGRIHCLDADGRGDGTTDEYWVYPSYRRAGVVDPNLSEGIDGVASGPDDQVTIAQMPSGFDLSTAVVQRISGEDYLYIGSRNGRVYCLEMAGRGDFVVANRQAGTTRRIWTYPNDYPTTAVPSSLGPIQGSLTYGTASGTPTIFVPTTVGRVLALNALPGAAFAASRTTSVTWTFPPVDQPTLGAIATTPVFEFGRILFGTAVRADGAPGRFFSLDADSGTQQWVFPTDADLNTNASLSTRSFLAGPATVDSATIVAAGGLGMPNTVFAANSNGFVYGLNADTGAPIWSTDELGSSASGSLTYTVINAFVPNGTLGGPVPVVVVPVASGRWAALFAGQDTENPNRVNPANPLAQGQRQVWGFAAQGTPLVASNSVADGAMYGADGAGFLYAWSNVAGIFAPGILPPGQREPSVNDRTGQLMRKAKLRLINRATYSALRLTAGASGHPQYTEVIETSGARRGEIVASAAVDRAPLAYEWGETMYLIVYDFPYLQVNSGAPPAAVPPPVVNVTFNVNGSAVRSIPVEARLFTNGESSPPTPLFSQAVPLGILAGEQDPPVGGYAVLAFTFQGGGPNALPPGNAEVTATISTQALNSARTVENALLDPTQTTRGFQLANPLAIFVTPWNNPAYNAVSNLGIGRSNLPQNGENLVNGSPDFTGVAKSRLLASAGFAEHGKPKTARIYVADRSMMGLIRPDGRGLDNVRVDMRNLLWQGGAQTIVKPLDPTLYPNFEDRPGGFPNVSLDYPDIRPDAITVTKDPNGNAENPLFGTVTLPSARVGGATLADGSVSGGRLLQDGDTPDLRRFYWVPFDFQINVPRFQPPNNARIGGGGANITSSPTGTNVDPRFLMPDSQGNLQPQGYIGRFNVYVDSSQNGILDLAASEAYRAFAVSATVLADQRMRAVTPTLDPSTSEGIVPLGSLAGGAGYSLAPYAGIYAPPNPQTFSPWGGDYAAMFQPFDVLNEGNINLLDVRLAKWTRDETRFDPLLPSVLSSSTNDDLAWMDGSMDLWSNFDLAYGPRNRNALGDTRAILPKPRPYDPVGTTLAVNPTPRANPNLGPGLSVSGDVGPNARPRVAVSVPIGFPVGVYSSRLQVIENDVSNEVLEGLTYRNDASGNRVMVNAESFTDPGLSLKYTVRETRLTNKPTPRTATQVDNLYGDLAPGQIAFRNRQPAAMRDPFGSMILAWASDRPVFQPTPGFGTDPQGGQDRIYFAGLDNAATFTASAITPPGNTAVNATRAAANVGAANNPGANPLRDLDFWTPASAGSWFKGSPASANGYPSQAPNTLFGAGVDPATVRYGDPAFPATGRNNPLDPYNPTASFNPVLMAFTGEAQVGAGANRQTVSRLFLAPVTTDADANVAAGAPIPVPTETLARKGRATVVQTGANAATILYPATSAGVTTIYVVRYENGAFTTPAPLPFGDAFDSIESLSATLRPYLGPDVQRNGQAALEVAFTGKLRGASSPRAFLGRLPVVNGRIATQAVDGSFATFPWTVPNLLQNEPVFGVGDGVYRTMGVDWDRAQNVDVQIQVGTAAPASVLRPATRAYDAESGRISYETTLGGRVSLDPASGTVRFTGGQPGRNAAILVTYAPRFLQVGAGEGAYGDAGVLFDRRTISDPSYWVRPSGAQATFADVFIKNDRYLLTFNRAGGAGVGARPAVKTLRFGVQLPTAIATNNAGVVQGLIVRGRSTGPYQADPQAGRVYFTAVDEDQVVVVTYRPIEPGTGNLLPARQVRAVIRPIVERDEAFVPIEQATNETSATMFVDPFDVASPSALLRRPSLLWLFWSSTRAGAPDLYFEGLAPKWTPLPAGR